MTKADAEEMAASVVLAIKTAMAPLQKKIAALEQRNTELAARILELEAARAARSEVDV
jgi:hypothetical protein